MNCSTFISPLRSLSEAFFGCSSFLIGACFGATDSAGTVAAAGALPCLASGAASVFGCDTASTEAYAWAAILNLRPALPSPEYEPEPIKLPTAISSCPSSFALGPKNPSLNCFVTAASMSATCLNAASGFSAMNSMACLMEDDAFCNASTVLRFLLSLMAEIDSDPFFPGPSPLSSICFLFDL